MKKNTQLKPTYISLFSSAGIGCYGFKLEGFDCVATSELLDKRLDIQRCNKKCKYKSGYISGDITKPEISQKIYNEIKKWKIKDKIKDIDVVIATPPCQGMSVANQKKTNEIKRNSLVVEAIDLINNINPKIFIFENVQAFLKTTCTSKTGQLIPIREEISRVLDSKYLIYGKVINFKNYGGNSSRQRTLVVGVRNDMLDKISPFEIFPNFVCEKTLKQVIGNFKSLKKMGEYDKNNPYHSFKKYDECMRSWIHDLKQGESAFNNKNPLKRPHKIIGGKVIQHKGGFGDKYKRQIWNKVPPCVHTANDCLASQNTIHPVDDRVFSIAELMEMMTIPKSFKWFNYDTSIYPDKLYKLICNNELNIRKCIGEAVPTNIFRILAHNIKEILIDNVSFLNDAKNEENKKVNKKENGVYYTNRINLSYIFNHLPDFKNKEISILEPSVGSGCFLPLIIKKYSDSHYNKINLYLNDMDAKSIKKLKNKLKFLHIPTKFKLFFTAKDYLTLPNKKYDLILGNPPFVPSKHGNLVELFWYKAIKESKIVLFISPKFLIFSPAYKLFRKTLSKTSINKIIDFGEIGFKDAKVETICLIVNNANQTNTVNVISIPNQLNLVQEKDYIFDKHFDYWLIYRNKFFDKVDKKLRKNIFSFIRSSEFNSTHSNSCGDQIWLIRSKNIDTHSPALVHIDNYDRFISKQDFLHSKVYEKIKELPDVLYLMPTLTYYPRVLKIQKNDFINCKFAVNGSIFIAYLKNKKTVLNKTDIEYFYSDEFRKYYAIAFNNCSRTLNIDENTIKFFGKRK